MDINPKRLFRIGDRNGFVALMLIAAIIGVVAGVLL